MRKRKLLTMLFALALVAAACGDDDDATGGDGGDDGGGDEVAGQLENKGTVELLSAGEPEETEAYQEIFDELITADADYEVEVISASDFAEQFQIQAEGGTLDVAAVPQPGAIADLAEQGHIVSLEDMGFDIAELNDLVGESFMALGEHEGEHYGLPTNINLKSMVWYPKDDFDAAGYEVPTTWDALIALSDQIVADGCTPWCVGFESGGDSGWPATDWMEDILLRTAGPEVYDQWARHEIPFNDPAVKAAARAVRRGPLRRGLRARWRGRHGRHRVRRRSGSDVRRSAQVLAAPPGDVHQLDVPRRRTSQARTTTGSSCPPSTRRGSCTAARCRWWARTATGPR